MYHMGDIANKKKNTAIPRIVMTRPIVNGNQILRFLAMRPDIIPVTHITNREKNTEKVRVTA